MARPLRILVAGLGGIGQRHARNLRTLLGDDLELIAYRARRTSPLLTEKMEVAEGDDVETSLGLRAYSNLSEALEQKPDAAIIANPTSLHLSVAMEAAAAGCHLFIEKPISHSIDGVEELLALVAAKKLTTVVGYQWRFHPLLAHAKDALERSAVGRVITVRAQFGEYLPGWHPYEDYRQSYAARRELGGGVLLTQIHDFDYLGWLFGWPSRVYCVGGTLSSLDINVEDTASTLMQCEMAGRHVPIHLHQDYVQRTPTRSFQVIGESGTMNVDLRSGTFSVLDEAGRESETESFDSFQRNQMFVAEMEHFLACMRGDEVSRVPVEEAAKSLRVALAARESLASGHVVTL